MKLQDQPNASSTQLLEAPEWLKNWEPENPEFFETTGKPIAWRTLIVTTFCLTIAFTTWFMVSAIVPNLKGIGFNITESQAFWLLAMPGLAAGTLRILHMFLVPIFGTRKTVTFSTLILLVPCLGWAWAVQNPSTSFGVLMALSFIAGLGGGNFSSFMPSTSLFFPKKKLGTALGIQAGIGNFGVSLVQFLVPIVIAFGAIGASQTLTTKGTEKTIYLQNAALIWIPFVLVGSVWAWKSLKSVPVKASFREQADIFKNKHTWLMTSLYIMTFGSFSGLAMVFPKLIGSLYGGFENAPNPLVYAFLGPLVGAGIRAAFGPVADKIGGAKVTMISAVGMVASAIGVSFYTNPTSVDQFQGFLWCMLALFLFCGIGNASTFKQMPMIFPPRQAAGVIGWTSAIAAYGPFMISVLIGWINGMTGNPTAFFYGAAAFYAVNLVINWWFYARKGAEKPC
ncbi:MAG TPA: nitrate/nitrite transporter [Fimbriimonas sp.]